MSSSSLESVQQVDDLGLDRHVERGRRLVGDQQLRLASRAPWRSSPAAASRRKARAGSDFAACGSGIPDAAQHLQRPGGARPSSMAAWQRTASVSWSTTVQRRVEARHRVLEHHGDVVAAQRAPSRNGRRSRSRPSKVHGAAGDVAGGEGSSRIIDSDVTVLPNRSRRRCRGSRPMSPRTTRRPRRGRRHPAARTPGRGRRPPAGRPTARAAVPVADALEAGTPSRRARGPARSTVVRPSRPAPRVFAPPSAARRPSPTALKQKTVTAMAGRPGSSPTGGRG